MKTRILLLFTVLTCGFTHASTLLVKEYGVNNTYSSIQSAINAATNNDTVLVYNKPSGQLWLENITIDKNLWIANPIDTARFTLQGNVTIVPKAGMQLMLVGYNLVGGGGFAVSSAGATATATNRATILISDAIVTGVVNLAADWLDVTMAYSSVTGQTSYRHGIIAGNILTGGLLVSQETTVGGGNDQDSIIIIGNRAAWMSIDTRGGVLVANNYINAVVNSNNWQAYGPAYQALGIFNHSSLSNVSCSIINNTIINNSNYVNGYSAGLVIRYYSNTAILNNVISGSCPDNTFYAYGLWTATSSTGSPFVSHNIIKSSNSNYVTNVPLNNELNYQQTGPGTLDAFGRAAAGNTFCINKGLYTGQYYDIDLTRNDIGTYGGPFSIDNYITNTGGKGRVFFIDVPHQISNINQLINIKAGAASKF